METAARGWLIGRAMLLALVIGSALVGGMGARASRSAAVPSGRARLSVTPAHLLPREIVRAVVHLRGLAPGLAVEVQVNPPAPALVLLTTVHTRANSAGAVDQPVSFPALRPGAYVVFVNLGSFADPRSTIPGWSMQVPLLVASSLPLLSFPCAAPLHTTIGCQLSGYGFVPHETLAIVYSVAVGTRTGGYTTTVYRRTSVADGAGSVTRPPFFFQVNPQVLSYRATATVTGARGDHASVMAVGMP